MTMRMVTASKQAEKNNPDGQRLGHAALQAPGHRLNAERNKRGDDENRYGFGDVYGKPEQARGNDDRCGDPADSPPKLAA